jgi:hypothetical protein
MQAVIFTHGDKGTPHLKRAKKWNPDVEFIVATLPTADDAWRNYDRYMRQWWIENRSLIQQGFVCFFEWDTLIQCNLNELTKYHAHVVCAYPRIKGVHAWQWWKEEKRLPKSLCMPARGIAPLAALGAYSYTWDMIFKSVLAPNVWNEDVYCELRLGSIMASLNLNVQGVHEMECCGHIPIHAMPTRKGIFHPVKKNEY